MFLHVLNQWDDTPSAPVPPSLAAQVLNNNVRAVIDQLLTSHLEPGEEDAPLHTGIQ